MRVEHLVFLAEMSRKAPHRKGHLTQTTSAILAQGSVIMDLSPAANTFQLRHNFIKVTIFRLHHCQHVIRVPSIVSTLAKG